MIISESLVGVGLFTPHSPFSLRAYMRPKSSDSPRHDAGSSWGERAQFVASCLDTIARPRTRFFRVEANALESFSDAALDAIETHQ